ncbi:aminotransferase class IV [Psychrobacter sp.]|uniref:aminotransferase class IV n=1 Tax=Psychrobacter sp. TaxID=56811 RepID=UPI0025E77128|nr:aminotransferase class IV [Psychrobacter sp.]
MTYAMVWYQLSDTGVSKLSPPASVTASPDLSSVANLTAFQSLDLDYLDIAPNLRALAYGDGFFTTIGVHKRQLVWPSYHQSRLHHHCQALQISLEVKAEELLWKKVYEFASNMEEGIIKIIVSRPNQSIRGYAYSAHASDNRALIWIGIMKTATLAEQTATFLAIDTDINKHPDHDTHPDQYKQLKRHQTTEQVILQQPPITAKCLKSQLASLPQPLAGLKSLNRLDGVMIAGELQRFKQSIPDLAEGLVADLNGNWVEGVMSNVFYCLKPTTDTLNNQMTAPTWNTAPILQSGVKGVMRQVIIDRFQQLNLPVQERDLCDEDLPQIQSMFFCNAVRGVIPVEKLLFQEHVFKLSLKPFIKNSVSM